MDLMDLKDLCVEYGRVLTGKVTHNEQPVDGGRLLWAIAGLESSWGRDREFARIEQAYMPGGRYYQADADLRALWKRYGALAACSFGTFQIMFKTAYELGYRQHPIGLQGDVICVDAAAALIKVRFINKQGAKTLRDVLDSYNSGYHRDAAVPAAYIRNGIALYEAGFERESEA